MSPATRAPASSLPWLRVPSAKTLITVLITMILVVGEWRFGITGGYDKLAITLGTCVGVEALLSYFLLGQRPRLQSA